MRITSLSALLLLIAATECKAQKDSVYVVPPPPPFENSLVISATAGLATGLGGEVVAGILPRLNGRLGFSTIGMSYSNNDHKIDGAFISVHAGARLSKIHLLGEYRPIPSRAFRLVGGLAYYFGSKLTIDLTTVDDFKITKIKVKKEELGMVRTIADWSGIAPYLGVGLGHSIPKKHFNVTFDAGLYRLSRPKVTIDATKLLEPSEANEPQLSANLKGYRWIPQLQLNFNYKIFSKRIIRTPL